VYVLDKATGIAKEHSIDKISIVMIVGVLDKATGIAKEHSIDKISIVMIVGSQNYEIWA